MADCLLQYEGRKQKLLEVGQVQILPADAEQQRQPLLHSAKCEP